MHEKIQEDKVQKLASSIKVGRTVQTQIRLLLKKQSDQGLPRLLFSQAFGEFQP